MEERRLVKRSHGKMVAMDDDDDEERRLVKRSHRKILAMDDDDDEERRLVKRSHRKILAMDEEEEDKVYKFRILLPSGTSIGLTLHEPGDEMYIDEFLESLKQEYYRTVKPSEISKSKRKIFWKNKGGLYLEDAVLETKIREKILFRRFKPYKCHFLRLHDGEKEITDSFENMWDLTPDTDLLMELPDEYTFETALADLIDNSLQAVWSNGHEERRLVSVSVNKNGISIFDTGPGMDASDENSIVKWGKMGASLHRISRRQAIGGKPPYLMPFFGMFGYGGPVASMHLGRRAVVSSKRKESKKVYTLDLEREALLKRSGDMTWRTNGGLRNPLEDEIRSSPHGSFTKVEILEPKMTFLSTFQLGCRLKDIYFPYIQFDGEFSTGKTIRPVEFQVNGDDLAEVDGGEVAITNLHSCNGPEFVLQLHFSTQQKTDSKSPGSRQLQEANARLRCVYFPIVQGKENIDRILEKLGREGCEVPENFDTFCRVSIRRLGRLLPDSRWGRIPFMEPRQKRGDKAQTLKRCFMRVKCFVETDAGFNPTPSKTDLAHHHPYTTALKNFGGKPPEKEKDVTIEIRRGGKVLSLLQLEKEYWDWVNQMHDKYDEEIDCGEDQPVIVVNPTNRKGLGITSDVVRVHEVIKRKGTFWKSGQNVKVLKGAVGCPKNNVYATIEYILLEGFQGDVGGEARLICRPIDLPNERGCLLTVNAGNPCLDIQGSLTFPISVIDSGKCIAMESAEWNFRVQKRRQNSPSIVDLLSLQQCQQLDIDGALPVDAPVSAGDVTPTEIVAVVRPASFTSSCVSQSLDQKFIVKNNFEMSMAVEYISNDNALENGKHLYAKRIKPSTRKGFHGLYIFPLGSKFPKLFCKAGVYKFTFSVVCSDSRDKKCEKRVIVKPTFEVGRWGLVNDEHRSYDVRVGSCLPHIHIACFDTYDNHMPFVSVPELMVQINMKGTMLVPVEKMKVELLYNQMILEISDILIESGELDRIRPDYEASLEIKCSQHKLFSVTIPCSVVPGPLRHVHPCSPSLEKMLLPGDVIEELLLEMFDAFGNHVKKGLEVNLNVNGFRIEARLGRKLEADDQGCINLGGILKVIGSYGRNVSFSVEYNGHMLFKKDFQVGKRELRVVSSVPDCCAAGTQLEKITFEIIDSEGTIDETIHDDPQFGQSHTLIITSESLEMNDSCQYSFRRGRCMVPVVSIPREPGIYSFSAAHSRHPELCMNIKIHVMQTPKLETVGLSEHDEVQTPSPGRTLLPNSFPSACRQMGTLVEYILNDGKDLESDVRRFAEQIKNHENTLDMLNRKKKSLEEGMSNLQASIEPQSLSQLDYVTTEKEITVKRIEGTEGTAASIYCDILLSLESQESQSSFMQDIVGIVALLGTVTSNTLSRILAEYLGEGHMLAVVCKSYVAGARLEKYGNSGEINRRKALHAVASELGKSINSRFLAICLEDISPYIGQLENNDPQMRLALPDPLLPTGKTPPGFLGYAVNMINLEIDHLHTRTSRGHGLRETLFYLLFGELQVYKTRTDMRQAYETRTDMRHGAVSLDGGIMKGNGVLSLGHGEPEVCFQVVTSEVHLQICSSLTTTDILKQIDDKRSELAKTCDDIMKEEKAHARAIRKFQKKKERLEMFMAEKEPLLSGNCF